MDVIPQNPLFFRKEIMVLGFRICLMRMCYVAMYAQRQESRMIYHPALSLCQALSVGLFRVEGKPLRSGRGFGVERSMTGSS